MDAVAICLGLPAVAALCVWGAHAAWLRGWHWLPLAALALVIAAALVFGVKSQTATGGYFPGLGEFLIAAGLLVSPGPGLLLGIILAKWRKAGTLLLAIYAVGLLLLLMTLVGL